MSGPLVVAAVDTTTAAGPVVAAAAAAARARGGDLLLVHASPWASARDRPVDSPARDLLAATEAGLRSAAQDAAGRGGALDVRWRLLAGDPVAALLSAASTADLLVVGSRARPRTERLLLGSVSAPVLASCPVPLLVVPAVPRTVLVGPAAPVVLGLDGRPGSAPTVALAFAEAERRRADLLAVHVWPAPSSASAWEHPEGPLDPADARDDEVRVWGEGVAGHRESYPDVVVRGVVRHGPVVPTLVGVAAAGQLLVVGRRGRARPGHRGTVAALAHPGDGPVLVVPLDPAG